MVIMRYLILSLVCAGCSNYYAKSDSSMALECSIAPFASVVADKLVSCANLSVNVSLAKELIIARGYLPDELAFNTLYSDVSIHVFDVRCLGNSQIGHCVFGEYSEETTDDTIVPQVSHGIDVDHDAVALGHELMHHYDVDYMKRSQSLSSIHDHWTQLGYYSLAADYQMSALPVME